TPSATPSAVVPGDTVLLFPFSVKNVGNQASNAPSGNVRTRLYLSPDPTITAEDTPLSVLQGELWSDAGFLTPNLGTGQVTAFLAPRVLIPNVLPGTYYIGILTDSDNEVAESLENNNYAAVQIQVVAPLAFVGPPPIE